MRDQTMLVDAHLMNGEVLRGVMISAISRYALTIETNDGTVYVSKHAVAWIGSASPNDSQGTTEVAHE